MLVKKYITAAEFAKEEGYSDALKEILDIFCDQVDYVFEDFYQGKYIDDIDPVEDKLKIIKSCIRLRNQGLTADEFDRLGLTIEECEDNDIPIIEDIYIPMRDNPDQMTFWPEEKPAIVGFKVIRANAA